MADETQLALLRSDVQAWNSWRREHSDTAVDLLEADLAGADLFNADLIRANLVHANLRGSYVSGADLYAANMARARENPSLLTSIEPLTE